MRRLISLFEAEEEELRLSRPPSGPPPSRAEPDYGREPVYFRHLLEYLRDAREGEGGEPLAPEAREQSEAVYA